MITYLKKLVALSVFGIGMSIASLCLQAQAASMSAPVRLSTLTGASRSPQIAAYGNNLYVVWAEGTAVNTYDIYFERSTNNGDSWQLPVKLASAVNTPSPSPQVAGGQNGVYVFWTDNYLRNSSGTGIYFSRSADSGTNFTSPVLVVPKFNDGYSRPTSVLVDPSAGTDHLFFAWSDSRYAPGRAEIGQAMLAVSCDAGTSFSTVQQVSVNDRGNDAESPRLARTSDGTLYMLYRSSLEAFPQQGGSAPFSQHLIRSSSIDCNVNPPVTWSQPSQAISHTLPEEFGNTYGGLIVAGAGNHLHMGYWSEANGNNLLHQAGYPTTSGWSDPVDVTSAVPGYGPNHLEFDGSGPEYGVFGLGEDSSGSVHVAMWQSTGTVIDGFKVGKVYYRKGSLAGSNYNFGAADTIVSSDLAFEPRAIVNGDRLATVWADFRDNNNGAGGSEIYYRHVFAQSATGKQISVGATLLDFGSQLINSTGAPRTVAVSVIGDQTVTFSGVSTSGPFSATTDCGVQVAGSTCTISLTFSPLAVGAASGALSINSDAVNAPHTVSLSGSGGNSLVDHYYYSILDRAPDSVGKAFWGNEVTRMAGLGVDPKEVFIVMADYFFTSPEYLAKGTSDLTFLGNLYRTFFARNPDAGGQSYWLSQLQAGMPRDIVMFNFLFSSEFNAFSRAFFNSSPGRAELLAVVDYYRGLLGRLPETSGLTYWAGQFHTAQCSGPGAAGAVYAQAGAISYSFLSSTEYLARSRSNSQYVSDLYNAFLRRGGDLTGFNFWVNELATGRRTRDRLRQDFIATPEFTNRINAIVAQGC